MPSIINIVDNAANRKFITDENAVGWIEQHEDVDVLHLYEDFAGNTGLVFVPVAQRDNVYCKDHFEHDKFINANQFFGKATDEKLAELSNIAYCLGAKSCSVEIIESESETSSRSMQGNIKGFLGASV